ncbi:MAG: efflux RND transporter periplasmic adaptor subunit [Bacteroidia bacterium]|nr:efflux RND transporter periplasmic adaptor subunit [Bacteroidia bacterium]
MKTKPFFFLIVFSIFIACKNNNSSEEKDVSDSNVIVLSKNEIQNLQIITDTLHKKNISSILHFKGKIDVPPQNIYSLSVPLGGYLKYTHLLPGMKIKKNETIAVLEDPQYIQLQEDYLSTKNQLALLEKNYTRQKDLWEQKAVSEKIYEQVSTEYENTKVKLKALEEKLNLINIYPKDLTADNISRTIRISAPFTGYVTNIYFSTGKYIQPSEILFDLVNPEDIHLNIKVFEKDLEHLKIGQKVWAYTNYNPNKKYPCEIILINKVVNTDGTIDVHCHFDKYDETLIPNTYMQADVIIENYNTYTIPSKAVVFYNNKHFVFIRKNEKEFEMREIKISNQTESDVGIENYKELLNKQIVINNAHALLMKSKNLQSEE